MLKLNDNFIGYTPTTKVDFFSGNDSEYLYKKKGMVLGTTPSLLFTEPFS